MERYRIKTILIVILLVINGFLLALVGARRSEALRYEQSALDQVIQVLEAQGIQMSADVIAGRTGQRPGTAVRSIRMEEEAASVLLGEVVEGNDRGGGLYTYSTDRGQISFRAGGEVIGDLAPDPVWDTDDPEHHAAGLMDSLAIDSQLIYSEVLAGSGEVTYQQLLNGAPLFSCRITFTYEAGRLTNLSGSLLAVEETDFEKDELLSLPTVLMHFLDDVLSSGDVCSAILAVEPGYLAVQSFTNTMQLRPVWYISTNTADYYVDGITGNLTRVTAR